MSASSTCPDRELARFLLKRGANPNLKNVFGDTPLHSTVMNTSIECMKLLCEFGADPRTPDDFFNITPLFVAKDHREALCILHNAKRKLEGKVYSLEHENTSYCIACGESSKIKRMRQCSKCKGPERYCSVRCQKWHWPSHKKLCKAGRKLVKSTDRRQELVFATQCALQWNGGHGCPRPSDLVNVITPNALFLEQVSEHVSERLGQCGIAKHRKMYQKKRSRRLQKQHNMNLKRSPHNQRDANEKFVIKIQVNEHPAARDKMVVYNRSRKYMVFIEEKGQTQRYAALMNVMKRVVNKGAGQIVMKAGFAARKAYFYAYVDDKQRLHVLTDTALAMQPW